MVPPAPDRAAAARGAEVVAAQRVGEETSADVRLAAGVSASHGGVRTGGDLHDFVSFLGLVVMNGERISEVGMHEKTDLVEL